MMGYVPFPGAYMAPISGRRLAPSTAMVQGVGNGTVVPAAPSISVPLPDERNADHIAPRQDPPANPQQDFNRKAKYLVELIYAAVNHTIPPFNELAPPEWYAEAYREVLPNPEDYQEWYLMVKANQTPRSATSYPAPRVSPDDYAPTPDWIHGTLPQAFVNLFRRRSPISATSYPVVRGSAGFVRGVGNGMSNTSTNGGSMDFDQAIAILSGVDTNGHPISPAPTPTQYRAAYQWLDENTTDLVIGFPTPDEYHASYAAAHPDNVAPTVASMLPLGLAAVAAYFFLFRK